jgi:Peptidase C13 family
MNSVWSVLAVASRAAVWRKSFDKSYDKSCDLPSVGLPALLAWAAALAAVRVAGQFAAAGLGAAFDPYGLNAVIAWVAVDLAVAALFVPPAARAMALAAMFALSIAGELIMLALKPALALIPALAAVDPVWRDQAAPLAAFVLISLWWIGGVAAILRSVRTLMPASSFGRAAALWAALVAVSMLLPSAPVFVAEGFDIHSANLWEAVRQQFAASAKDRGAARGSTTFEHAQAALLQAEADGLAPPEKGATNIYALGIAGWADQDVFVKELDGALAALGSVLPIRGRTLRLVNHRETADSVPIANQRNFAAAVHAIGAVMNKDTDVLLLLMTSHGEPSGFGLRLPSDVISELTPREVATALSKEGIKNRIVIVSACYAGVFVPPLANDDTIVLTAADAKHTSFGCAPERDWTYFGDALFRQSIRPGRDL